MIKLCLNMILFNTFFSSLSKVQPDCMDRQGWCS